MCEEVRPEERAACIATLAVSIAIRSFIATISPIIAIAITMIIPS